MSDVKRLQFSTVIQAPPQVVWDVMLGRDTYPLWARAFAEGSYFEGSWEEGSRMRFLIPSGDGMLAEIAEHRPREFLSIRHLGFIVQGKEDTDSEVVRAWAPAYENYTLRRVPDGTELIVDQDVTAEFETYMRQAWPKALVVLKQLCEERAAG